MERITLSEIEQEILDIFYDAHDFEVVERLEALARRIAVAVETAKAGRG